MARTHRRTTQLQGVVSGAEATRGYATIQMPVLPAGMRSARRCGSARARPDRDARRVGVGVDHAEQPGSGGQGAHAEQERAAGPDPGAPALESMDLPDRAGPAGKRHAPVRGVVPAQRLGLPHRVDDRVAVPDGVGRRDSVLDSAATEQVSPVRPGRRRGHSCVGGARATPPLSAGGESRGRSEYRAVLRRLFARQRRSAAVLSGARACAQRWCWVLGPYTRLPRQIAKESVS